jgi:pyruvate dehydrogenase E1 component alpha subunit
MDLMAVYEAGGEAVARARRGEGPSIIEALCYRYRGHFEGDAEPYRTPEEVAEWKKKDPIPKFRQQLTDQGVLTKAQAKQIDAELAAEVKAAEDFARTSPFPAPEEALEHVFA